MKQMPRGYPILTVRTSLVDDKLLSRSAVAEALLSQGSALIDLVTTFPDGEETEFVGFGRNWDHSKTMVRDFLTERFMKGCCWHYALALHRAYDMQLGGLVHWIDNELVIDHVYGVLPDGNYLDIRGIHETLESLASYRPPEYLKVLGVRSVSVEEILGELDSFARDARTAAEDWNDPHSYGYARFSDQLVSVLEGETIERFYKSDGLYCRRAS